MNKVEKPRIAKVYPSDDGKKKLTLMIPGRFVRETAVMSHEKLSVLRSWCIANNYKIDESLLRKPEKPKAPPEDDYDFYSSY